MDKTDEDAEGGAFADECFGDGDGAERAGVEWDAAEHGDDDAKRVVALQ